MIIFEKDYDEEDLYNFEDSVYDNINALIQSGQIKSNEYGESRGTYTVTVEWSDEDLEDEE
jgi:hypothetical protein